MQTNVRHGFYAGLSPALPAGPYRIRRCVHAIMFTCAVLGMMQAALALPDAAKSGVAATKPVQMATAQSAVAQTTTFQPSPARSSVAQTTPSQPSAAQTAVVSTTTVQNVAAQSAVARTITVQPSTAQPAVAQPAAIHPAAPISPPAKATQTESKKIWVIPDQPVKKKIVFTQFDVAIPGQVGDINNIDDGLPAELSRRMGTSRQFLSASSPYSIPKGDAVSQQQAVTQIAGETGAQFLVSGLVLDAGIHDGKRYIEVELSAYDGFTGNPILSRRFEDQTDGDVHVGRNIPFGSSAFFDTDFGHAVNRLIDTAVKGIQAALADVPFAAHIVRAQGNEVIIDAGANSLLKPGYKLVAYTNESQYPVNNLLGSNLGDIELPADVITLTDIQPQFSIGKMSHDAATLGVKAGKVARINDADLQYLAEHPNAMRKMTLTMQKIASANEATEMDPGKVKTVTGVARHKATGQARRSKVEIPVAKRKVIKKTGHTPIGKKKKPENSACDQLASLRAACEKK